MRILDAQATARALAWPALVAAVEATIRDSRSGLASAPPRVSVPLGGDAVWLLMPAVSQPADLAACKLITVHSGNPARGLPTIQGDILVIRSSTGERLALLDGPAVTARRTAAVTALAIRQIQQARSAPPEVGGRLPDHRLRRPGPQPSRGARRTVPGHPLPALLPHAVVGADAGRGGEQPRHRRARGAGPGCGARAGRPRGDLHQRATGLRARARRAMARSLPPSARSRRR